MKGSIYGLSCVCHPESGIRYVGQTAQKLNVRLTNHRAHARFGTDTPVYRWIRKHGTENIAIALISEHGLEAIDDAERAAISAIGLEKLLNIAVGGKDGTTLGRKRPEFSELIRGDKSPHRVLKSEDVTRLRAEFNGSHGQVRKFAKEFGVSDTTISDMLMGRSWAHLPLGSVVPKKRVRLTEEQVRQIRRENDSGKSYAELSDAYKVTVSNISYICRRITWPDLD